jgi:hypothetical protein
MILTGTLSSAAAGLGDALSPGTSLLSVELEGLRCFLVARPLLASLPDTDEIP